VAERAGSVFGLSTNSADLRGRRLVQIGVHQGGQSVFEAQKQHKKVDFGFWYCNEAGFESKSEGFSERVGFGK
jgi:hypothetical protein